MLKASLFGKSCLTSADNRIINVFSAKEVAVLIYLSRQAEQQADRREISELLWSDVDSRRQQSSMRQAIRSFRVFRDRTGIEVLQASGQVLKINRGGLLTDVDEIHDALSNVAKHAIAKAQRLLAPTFLDGFTRLGSRFHVWRNSEERRVRARLIERVAMLMGSFPEIEDPLFAGLARFILKVDPAFEWGHQRLIQHYLARARRDLALRQLFDCERELENKNGSVPTAETRDLFSASSISDLGCKHRSGRFGPPPVDRSSIFPIITIQSHQALKPLDRGSHLLSEFVEQIGRNRELVAELSPIANGASKDPKPIALDDARGGQFSFEVRDSNGANDVQVALKSRVDGKPVYFDSLPIRSDTPYEDRARIIGRSIFEMQKRLRNYYKFSSSGDEQAYRRLSNAYTLIGKFTKDANDEGLKILGGLESEFQNMSLIYSFKASLYLQQKLFLRMPRGADSILKDAREMAAKAVELDPWHAVNHRYLSFAYCFSEDFEKAKEHILLGQERAPADPLQTIATAEVCAFAGDIQSALEYSNETLKSINNMPRYTYGYLANIQFSAGNYEQALIFAQRAPAESIVYRATAVASLWELGRIVEARGEMHRIIEYLQKQYGFANGISIDRICQWLGEFSPFSNPQTRFKHRENIRRAASLL